MQNGKEFVHFSLWKDARMKQNKLKEFWLSIDSIKMVPGDSLKDVRFIWMGNRIHLC